MVMHMSKFRSPDLDSRSTFHTNSVILRSQGYMARGFVCSLVTIPLTHLSRSNLWCGLERSRHHKIEEPTSLNRQHNDVGNGAVKEKSSLIDLCVERQSSGSR